LIAGAVAIAAALSGADSPSPPAERGGANERGGSGAQAQGGPQSAGSESLKVIVGGPGGGWR
jgi:hypothetical protein